MWSPDVVALVMMVVVAIEGVIVLLMLVMEEEEFSSPDDESDGEYERFRLGIDRSIGTMHSSSSVRMVDSSEYADEIEVESEEETDKSFVW